MSELPLFGQTFRLADKPNRYAITRFMALASKGDDLDEGTASAAVMDLLQRCVHPDDWQRFDQACLDNDADWERDLMPVVAAVYQRATEQATDRPTPRPSVSSDGPPAIAPSSTDVSSSPVTRLQTRPDLMVIVEDSQAALRTG